MKKIIKQQMKRLLVRLFINSMVLCMCNTSLQAQRSTCHEHFKPGIAGMVSCSGNGHGAYYDMLLSLRVHRSTFIAGPGLQKVSGSFNSGKIWYSYSLSGVEPSCKKASGDWTDPCTELSFFVSAQYYSGARFSKSVLLMESGNVDESLRQHYLSIKVNTVEVSAGMGFHFRISERLHLRTFVGLAYYQHLDFHENMAHDARAVALTTGLGLGLFN